MADQSPAPDEGGHIVRAPDGSLHFIRDSLLAQTKLSPDLAAEASKILGDTAPPTDSSHLHSVARVNAGAGAGAFNANNMAMSTVMCPSIFGSRLEQISQPE